MLDAAGSGASAGEVLGDRRDVGGEAGDHGLDGGGVLAGLGDVVVLDAAHEAAGVRDTEELGEALGSQHAGGGRGGCGCGRCGGHGELGAVVVHAEQLGELADEEHAVGHAAVVHADAKLAGITLTQAHRWQHERPWNSCLPTNLYEPGDNYDLETSHVLPALIRRFHEAAVAGAPSVTLWGTGTPRREFLHVDDLAAACVRLLEVYDDPSPINIGTGEDLTIAALAAIVAGTVGYEGEIVWDTSRPDGTPRKLLDVTPMRALGWEPAIGLAEGIRATWEGYVATLSA